MIPPSGNGPIADIEPPELREVIRKVEARGAIELAKREMQVVGQIFRSPSPLAGQSSRRRLLAPTGEATLAPKDRRISL